MTISILCGGSGTRLWPLSRELLPKQFAPILPPQKQDSNQNPYLATTANEETSSLFAKKRCCVMQTFFKVIMRALA